MVSLSRPSRADYYRALADAPPARALPISRLDVVRGLVPVALLAWWWAVQARADYLALLDDLEQNFAARNEKLLLEDRGDLNIEIDVLRARLEREGVQLDRPS